MGSKDGSTKVGYLRFIAQYALIVMRFVHLLDKNQKILRSVPHF